VPTEVQTGNRKTGLAIQKTDSGSGGGRYGTVGVTGRFSASPRISRNNNAMDKRLQIRGYDYVNHPYDRVRDVLKTNALAVFKSATKAAASRAESVAAELHVDFGGLGVKADIDIVVKGVDENPGSNLSVPSTTLRLEWKSASLPQLFPLMQGELSVYPLTSTETQVDFSGIYEPPFGAVGKTMNAIVGHRIAEASVHRFVNDVAGYLRQAVVR